MSSLLLIEFPRATVIPVGVRVPENVTVRFQCFAEGSAPVIIWRREGNLDLPEGVAQSGNILHILKVHKCLAGKYECRVTNFNNNIHVAEAVVIVTGKKV